MMRTLEDYGNHMETWGSWWSSEGAVVVPDAINLVECEVTYLPSTTLA